MDLIFISALRYLFLIVFYIFIFYVIKLIIFDIKYNNPLKSNQNFSGQLKIISGEELEPGSCFAVGSSFLIGRDSSNDMQINNDFVSKNHARIFRHNHNYLLEDLKSLNGTYLNNKPVKKTVPLLEGDIITVGGVTFKFERCTYEVE